jgi:hypothetical protein
MMNAEAALAQDRHPICHTSNQENPPVSDVKTKRVRAFNQTIKTLTTDH